jgi:SAM-dependent methyltransferase
MLDRALDCLRRGRFQDAAGRLEKVFDAEPENPAAHHLAGLMHHQRGRAAEARRHLEQAVKGAPDNPEFHLDFGVVLGDLGRADDAIRHYRTALSLAPGTPAALANLGFALGDKGDYAQALDAFGQALSAEPGHIGAQLGFAHILGGLRAGHYSQELETALLRAFGLVHANHARLAAAAAHLLGLKYGLSQAVPGDSDIAPDIAKDALFEAFLTRCVNIDVRMEHFLTGLRRRLVLAAPGSHSADALKAAGLLGVQCFINEYIFFRQADETEAAARIKKRLEEALAAGAGVETLREPALIYAMHGPLGAVRGAGALAGLDSESLGPDLDRLVRLTVRDHLAEAALREKIETSGPITDATSQAVRAQYEENPYPRWLDAPAQQPASLSALLGGMFPHFTPPAFGPTLNILIAGSGTGQHVAHVARTHPQANILAIDLSKASIAYAMRMMEKLGLSNVRFMQADILEAAAIGGAFDMIQSVGVLHHMKDPLRGWRVLAGLLKPGGVFKLGLYSGRGRRHVREARSLIEAEGIESSADGIAAFRHKLLTEKPGGDLARIIETPDFFTTSMCRDLLFHVHEHHTTPKRIKRDLAQLGLEFIGFEQFEEAGINDAYRQAYPGDAALTDLDNWDAFEAAHGGFIDMYLLWCRKPE